MGLLELLAAAKEILGHSNVRWDTDPETKEIRLYTGLTARDEYGNVAHIDDLRPTAATLAITETEN